MNFYSVPERTYFSFFIFRKYVWVFTFVLPGGIPGLPNKILPPPKISEHFRKKENKKKKRREIRKATAEDVRERETRARASERERERERVRVKAPECLFPSR